MKADYEKQFNNKEIDFLFESYDDEKKAYHGHSSNYLEIYTPSDEILTGKIKKVVFKI